MGLLGLLGFLVVVYIVFMLVTAGVGILFDLLISLLVWGVIGWLAGKLVRGGGYGPLHNVLLGLAGGVIGGFLFRLIGIGAGGLIGTLLSGVVGAVIVIVAMRTFSSNRSFGT